MLVSGSEGEGAAHAAWQGCAASGGEHYWAGLGWAGASAAGQGGLRGGVACALVCAMKPACYCECLLLQHGYGISAHGVVSGY